jgi:hypothetical protein
MIGQIEEMSIKWRVAGEYKMTTLTQRKEKTCKMHLAASHALMVSGRLENASPVTASA